MSPILNACFVNLTQSIFVLPLQALVSGFVFLSADTCSNRFPTHTNASSSITLDFCNCHRFVKSVKLCQGVSVGQTNTGCDSVLEYVVPKHSLNDWYLIGMLKFLKVEHTNLKIQVCLKHSHLLKYGFPQHPFWLSGPVMGELWSGLTLLRDILDQRMHIKCFFAKSTPTQRIHSWATHLTFCVTICFVNPALLVLSIAQSCSHYKLNPLLVNRARWDFQSQIMTTF